MRWHKKPQHQQLVIIMKQGWVFFKEIFSHTTCHLSSSPSHSTASARMSISIIKSIYWPFTSYYLYRISFFFSLVKVFIFLVEYIFNDRDYMFHTFLPFIQLYQTSCPSLDPCLHSWNIGHGSSQVLKNNNNNLKIIFLFLILS